MKSNILCDDIQFEIIHCFAKDILNLVMIKGIECFEHW